MHTNTSDHYDIIIIGAGVAGSSAAYTLYQKAQRVLMVDRSSVPASGGSGAAGAFVSPKIGKGGPLQRLTNQAFEYAQDFYVRHFAQHFTQSGVVRIPKDDADALKFALYEPHNYPLYEKWNSHKLSHHGITDPHGGFYFPEAGDCDAPAMVMAMASGVDFIQYDVQSLERVEHGWRLGGSSLTATQVVLATGYQNDLFDMRYMGVKGLWGSRGDFMASAHLDISMHKSISISSIRDGVVKIGATHVKHPHPCTVCDGQPLASLLDKADELVDMSSFVLRETFCGMRAGSRDYFPLVGRVIDVEYMLVKYPEILRGAKPPLAYLDDIFVLNGLGGRGFVWAPLMSKWLSEYMVDGKPIHHRVDPDRLFWKWARRPRYDHRISNGHP